MTLFTAIFPKDVYFNLIIIYKVNGTYILVGVKTRYFTGPW